MLCGDKIDVNLIAKRCVVMLIRISPSKKRRSFDCIRKVYYLFCVHLLFM